MEVEDRLAIPPCKPEHRKLETPQLMKTTGFHFGQIAATIALLLAGATQKVIAQTSSTDPVGFVTLSVNGNGSPSSVKYSIVSPTLTQPVSWHGVITGVSTAAGQTTITVSGTPWTAGQFNGANGSFYVEIVSAAAYSGTLAEITATTTGSITTLDNLSGLAAVDDTIKIRKDVTIADVFGATNTAGLLASDDSSTADEVIIYTTTVGGTLSSKSVFYYTGDGSNPAGWYDSILGTPAGSTIVPLHTALVIKRKASANVSFTFTGSVKTGNTHFPVQNGLNVLATASAQGLTLATSGLYTGNAATGVKATDDASTADEITFYGTNNSTTKYFYYTGDLVGNPAGWYNSIQGTPAGNVAIAPGQAFLLNRKASGSFNWVLPLPNNF